MGDRGNILGALQLVALASIALTSCGTDAPPARPAPTPAEDQAAHLRAIDPPAEAEASDLRRQEVAAGIAAAHARVAGDTAEADRQAALSAELGRLRMAAEQLAREQRVILDRRIAEADALAAAEREQARQRQERDAQAAAAREVQARRDRWILWSGISIGLSVFLAGVLLIAKVPKTYAIGIPASMVAGDIVLASWLAVPWLPVAIGCVFGLAVLLSLVVLVRVAVREWQHYANRLTAEDRADADAASLARQPAPIRWMFDHLLQVPHG